MDSATVRVDAMHASMPRGALAVFWAPVRVDLDDAQPHVAALKGEDGVWDVPEGEFRAYVKAIVGSSSHFVHVSIRRGGPQ